MLHIIKNYKKLFCGLVESRFDEWGSSLFDLDDDKDIDSKDMDNALEIIKKLNIDNESLVSQIDSIKSAVWTWPGYDLNNIDLKDFINTIETNYNSDMAKIKAKYQKNTLSIISQSSSNSDLLKTKTNNISEENIRHSNSDIVEYKIDNHNAELDETSRILTISTWLTNAFKEMAANDAEWYSITRILNEVFGKNNVDKIVLDELDRQDLNIKANSWKIERALETLGLHKEGYDSEFPRNEINPAMKFLSVISPILNVIWKSLPWATWVYLTDANIPWTSKIVPWLSLAKSTALHDWIQSWMEWEFEFNEEKAKYGRESVASAWDLRGVLTTYIWETRSEDYISWKISKLSTKEDHVIRKAIKNAIIDQLEYANNESFHWGPLNFIFDTLLSNDAKNGDSVLNELKWLLTYGSLDEVFNKITELNSLHYEEDERAARDVVQSNKNKTKFFNELKINNKYLNKASQLLKIWENKLSIIYKFENKEGFVKAYWLEDFKWTIDKVYTAIESWDMSTLQNLSANEKELFSVIWTDKLWEYRIKYLKNTTWITQINEWRHRHWVDLRWMDSAKVYNALTENGVVPGESSLQTIYKWLILTNKLNNVWFIEFNEAMKKTQDVSMSALRWKVINTSRQWIHNSAVTTFEKWFMKLEESIKHTYIDKEFTTYNGGQKVTETVRYNIYIKPECSNLLIVPESISWTQRYENAPLLDDRMFNEIPLTMPIVIPYALFQTKTKTRTETHDENQQIEGTRERTWTWTWTHQVEHTREIYRNEEVLNPDVTTTPWATTWTAPSVNFWSWANSPSIPWGAPVWSPLTTPGWSVWTAVPTYERVLVWTETYYTTEAYNYTYNYTETYFRDNWVTITNTVSEQVARSCQDNIKDFVATSLAAGLAQNIIFSWIKERLQQNWIPTTPLKEFTIDTFSKVSDGAQSHSTWIDSLPLAKTEAIPEWEVYSEVEGEAYTLESIAPVRDIKDGWTSFIPNPDPVYPELVYTEPVTEPVKTKTKKIYDAHWNVVTSFEVEDTDSADSVVVEEAK